MITERRNFLASFCLLSGGLLVIAALSAAGCQKTDADSIEQTLQENSEFALAKKLAKRALNIVRANAEKHPDDVLPLLAGPLSQIEQLSLSEQDMQSLQEFVESSGQDVKQIIQSWGDVEGYAFLPPTGEGECWVYCLLFFLIDCDTGNLVGTCFGIWDCSAGTVVECDQGGGPLPGGDTECLDDGDCAPGWRCATWVFKANECVKECDSNSDCPSGQKCKKPFGTSFKRCK